MPRKLSTAALTPTLVLERLGVWGRCIRTQRVKQNIASRDLCARMGISDATLRRLEHGDPGASAASYLAALMILGVLDYTAPMPEARFWSGEPHSRARPALADDHDDF